MSNPDTQIALIDSWLSSKSCTLWMDWDISRPERRQLAAQWLYKTINEFDDYVISLTKERVDL